jgi:hypothetical protein
MYAAASSHVDAMRLLLDVRKVNVNELHTNGGLALLEAATGGAGEAMQFLLEQGARPDLMDLDGVMPLHAVTSKADYNGTVALLESLKKVKNKEELVAHINLPSHSSGTAVMFVAAGGHPKCTKLMIDKGADVPRLMTGLSLTAGTDRTDDSHPWVAFLAMTMESTSRGLPGATSWGQLAPSKYARRDIFPVLEMTDDTASRFGVVSAVAACDDGGRQRWGGGMVMAGGVMSSCRGGVDSCDIGSGDNCTCDGGSGGGGGAHLRRYSDAADARRAVRGQWQAGWGRHYAAIAMQ